MVVFKQIRDDEKQFAKKGGGGQNNVFLAWNKNNVVHLIITGIRYALIYLSLFFLANAVSFPDCPFRCLFMHTTTPPHPKPLSVRLSKLISLLSGPRIRHCHYFFPLHIFVNNKQNSKQTIYWLTSHYTPSFIYATC